jgi:Integral membrane protein (intg_mem_TP0381)
MALAQVFGEKHFFGTGILLLIVFTFLLLLKKNASDLKKQQLFYLYLFTGLFLVIEILRLIFLFIRDGGLAIYQLPLNLCSVPLYLYPAISLDKKNGRLKQWLMPAAFATVMLAGLIALLIPTNILGPEMFWFPLNKNFVEIASFTYHAVMIAAPLALIKLDYYKPKMSDIGYALAFTGGFAALAMTVNAFTNQDFLLLNNGNGSPFQFLITESKLLYQFTMIGLGAMLISLFFVFSNLGKLKSPFNRIQKGQMFSQDTKRNK